MIRLRTIFALLKATVARWLEDGAARMGASLSYYTAFSLAPLLLLSIAIGGLVFGKEAAQGKILDQLSSVMGSTSAGAIQNMIQAAQKPVAGTVATLIGFMTLLVGASGVLKELKFALNKIWRVKQKSGIAAAIKNNLLSFGMVLAIGFLLLVSLMFSTALATVGRFFGGLFPIPEFVLHLLELTVSFGVITVLFAALLRFLPDASIGWKNVWVGAALTSFLFVIGKFLLGLYLGKGMVGSSYGAAGSVLAILTWVYYSAQILYFGAELTKVYTERAKPIV